MSEEISTRPLFANIWKKTFNKKLFPHEYLEKQKYIEHILEKKYRRSQSSQLAVFAFIILIIITLAIAGILQQSIWIFICITIALIFFAVKVFKHFNLEASEQLQLEMQRKEYAEENIDFVEYLSETAVYLNVPDFEIIRYKQSELPNIREVVEMQLRKYVSEALYAEQEVREHAATEDMDVVAQEGRYASDKKFEAESFIDHFLKLGFFEGTLESVWVKVKTEIQETIRLKN